MPIPSNNACPNPLSQHLAQAISQHHALPLSQHLPSPSNNTRPAPLTTPSPAHPQPTGMDVFAFCTPAVPIVCINAFAIAFVGSGTDVFGFDRIHLRFHNRQPAAVCMAPIRSITHVWCARLSLPKVCGPLHNGCAGTIRDIDWCPVQVGHEHTAAGHYSPVGVSGASSSGQKHLFPIIPPSSPLYASIIPPSFPHHSPSIDGVRGNAPALIWRTMGEGGGHWGKLEGNGGKWGSVEPRPAVMSGMSRGLAKFFAKFAAGPQDFSAKNHFGGRGGGGLVICTAECGIARTCPTRQTAVLCVVPLP